MSPGQFALRLQRLGLFVFVLGIGCALVAGCGPAVAPAEPDAKINLKKVLALYQAFVERNRKGPASQQELVEFGKKLTPQERDAYLIGEDLEGIFISPRDKQPYVISYNLSLAPGGPTKAVAWEATGKDGRRFVALTMGYVEEYDEQTFNEYK
jgi:hypothetical protein